MEIKKIQMQRFLCDVSGFSEKSLSLEEWTFNKCEQMRYRVGFLKVNFHIEKDPQDDPRLVKKIKF